MDGATASAIAGRKVRPDVPQDAYVPLILLVLVHSCGDLLAMQRWGWIKRRDPGIGSD